VHTHSEWDGDGDDMVLAPGCYDPLGARLIEEAGFPAVSMSGFATAAGRLGRPDVGLLTLSQMVDNARRIAQAVAVRVIADADTGYGNPLNVIRAVHEYEAPGVAAIHLEDQVMPKKCGHLDGKPLIGAGEMQAKVSAAVAARSSGLAATARPVPTSCSWSAPDHRGDHISNHDRRE
jgi:2,3-dimethylmalate lyase